MRPIILILGPTAGGKTRLAIDLAGHLPGGGECVCCDSMQVYRGMDIGTAKPTARERAEAPHHLFDIADPGGDEFSVDTWLGLAEQAIVDIRARGRWPIVVGGTNLYVKALLEGLFEGPPPDPALRATLAARSPEALREELESIDPAAAERIHPNDRRRTTRAIEVFRQTGTPISALQREWDRGCVRTDAFIVGLEHSVESINRRINDRVRAMFAAGLVDEVRRLADAGRLGPQAREALGYRQLLEHLDGRGTEVDAMEQVKIRTRRFAKQQRTWLRRFRAIEASTWIDATDKISQTILHESLTAVLSFVAGVDGGDEA